MVRTMMVRRSGWKDDGRNCGISGGSSGCKDDRSIRLDRRSLLMSDDKAGTTSGGVERSSFLMMVARRGREEWAGSVEASTPTRARGRKDGLAVADNRNERTMADGRLFFLGLLDGLSSLHGSQEPALLFPACSAPRFDCGKNHGRKRRALRCIGRATCHPSEQCCKWVGLQHCCTEFSSHFLWICYIYTTKHIVEWPPLTLLVLQARR
jgi:hypothetical protein